MKILNKIKKIIPTKIFKALQPCYHYLLAWFSAFIYRFPSEKLIVIGVTGTTGKTTSVYMIAKMLEAAGYKTGYTSTAMFNDGKKEWLNDKKMTMLGRFFTQRMLREMVSNGCKYVIVETTSEGIVQFRHKFINYDILVFTGLYPEHVDSHGGFENYKKAKGELFKYLKSCKVKYVDENRNIVISKSGIKKLDFSRIKKTTIVNLDDEHVDYFLGFWSGQKYGYRLSGGKKEENKKIDELVEYGDIEVSGEGTSMKINNKTINLKLLGSFNATNAMNAVCVGMSQKMNIDIIKKSLEDVVGVPGRFECINEDQDFIVIVDYAYEPNAVINLYKTLKLIPHKKIIHVLGSCGGGRDVARRPKMGKLAGENADYVIITNEDPYDDDPGIIIDSVTAGAENVGKKIDKNLFKIIDRREAIKKALSLANKGDIVLITGKGSEQAICIANGEKISWDDRAVVRGLLNK